MTAVEWLVDELGSYLPISIKEVQLIIEQAKEMEKQQIIDALKSGVNMEIKGVQNYSSTFQQYCKETFNR
jgi:hypothetical protein